MPIAIRLLLAIAGQFVLLSAIDTVAVISIRWAIYSKSPSVGFQYCLSRKVALLGLALASAVLGIILEHYSPLPHLHYLAVALNVGGLILIASG